MKRSMIFAAAAATLMTAATIAPANAGGIVTPNTVNAQALAGDPVIEQVRWRGRRRGVAIGAGIVTLGILGAIAADRAYSRPYYYRDRYHDDGRWQCRRWRRACANGNDRACWHFDTRC